MYLLRRNAIGKPNDKTAVCEPRVEASGEIELENTLILDFQYVEL